MSKSFIKILNFIFLFSFIVSFQRSLAAVSTVAITNTCYGTDNTYSTTAVTADDLQIKTIDSSGITSAGYPICVYDPDAGQTVSVYANGSADGISKGDKDANKVSSGRNMFITYSKTFSQSEIWNTSNWSKNNNPVINFTANDGNADSSIASLTVNITAATIEHLRGLDKIRPKSAMADMDAADAADATTIYDARKRVLRRNQV